MRKAARARQRILAAFLPIAAVLYISCEALDPKGTDQVITDMATGLQLLAIAGRHPTQLYVAGTLSLLALGAVAVSYAAICLLVTGRGWVIATVAALLGGIGAFCGAITNVLVGIDLAAAATAHVPRRGGAVPGDRVQLRRRPAFYAAAQSARGPIVIAWMAPWGIAMILLAARIWQAAGQPASTPEPQPAAEPVSTS